MIDLNHKLPNRKSIHLKKCRHCKNTFIITSDKFAKTDCCKHSSLFDVQKRFTTRFISGSISSGIIYAILFGFAIKLSENLVLPINIDMDIIRKIFFLYGLIGLIFILVIPILFYKEFVSVFMLSSIKIRSEIQNGFDNSEVFLHNKIVETISSVSEMDDATVASLRKYHLLAYELSFICDSPALACARIRALLSLPLTKDSFSDLERISKQLLIGNNLREYQIVYFIERAAVLNPVQIKENTLKLYKSMLDIVKIKHPEQTGTPARFSAISKVFAAALASDSLYIEYHDEIKSVADYMTPWDKIIYKQLQSKSIKDIESQ